MTLFNCPTVQPISFKALKPSKESYIYDWGNVSHVRPYNGLEMITYLCVILIKTLTDLITTQNKKPYINNIM